MKKEEVKKPKKRMTADEVMAHVFHPKVAEHLRKHVEGQSDEMDKPKK
jgi:hypothetical protein